MLPTHHFISYLHVILKFKNTLNIEYVHLHVHVHLHLYCILHVHIIHTCIYMYMYMYNFYNTIHVFGTYICSCQTVKTKEEKEVLEHFAGVVSSSVVTNMCMYNVLHM